jgi:HlyD family secretion protein
MHPTSPPQEQLYKQLEQQVRETRMPGWAVISALSGMVALGAGWLVLGRIPVYAQGKGILIYPHQVSQVQAPGSGTLGNLYVQSGQRIQAGQLVGQLDLSLLRQQLQQTQSQLQELKRQQTQSQELMEQRSSQELRTLQLQRQKVEIDLRAAEANLPQLRRAQANSLEISRQRIAGQLADLRQMGKTLTARLGRFRKLHHEGGITREQLLVAEEQLQRNNREMADLEIRQGQLGLEGNQYQQQILQNLSLINDLRKNLNEIKTRELQLREQDSNTQRVQQNQIRDLQQQIARLELQLRDQGRIISPTAGTVLQLAVMPGQRIGMGTPILSIQQENSGSRLMAVAYLGDRDGRWIKDGMRVQVSPASAKKERFGAIVGQVNSIALFPVQSQEVTTMVGSPELAQSLLEQFRKGESGTPVQVIAQLEQATTPSGYRWSGSQGPDLKLTPGTSVTVQVQVAERAPISYVLPFLKKVTGLN